MFASAYNVLIISPSDISEERIIAENALDKWNKRYSNDRKKFLFLNAYSGTISEEMLKEMDLVIVLFLRESVSKNWYESVMKIKDERIPILIYFIYDNVLKSSHDEKLNSFKENIENHRECSKEEFEFFLTCDISAFDDWNDNYNYNTDSYNTFIEYGVVNIKVNGSVEECEDGRATVTYLGSSHVVSMEQVEYKDHVVVASTQNSKIVSTEFAPKETVLRREKYNDNLTFLEYKLTAPDRKLDFTAKIVVNQLLQKKKGGIGLHIPYFTKYLIIKIDISEAPFIKQYNGIAKLIYIKTVRSIDYNYDEKLKTYTFTIKNALPNSDMAFEWGND